MKRRKPVNLTTKTREHLRREGWAVDENVEKNHAHDATEFVKGKRVTKRRFWKTDLGGFADVIAWGAGRGTLLVQVCAISSWAPHLTKIIAEPRALEWLRASADNRIELHGWSQPGGPGSRWKLKCRAIVAEDFAGELAKRGSPEK